MSCLFPIIDGMSLEIFGSKLHEFNFCIYTHRKNILSGVLQQTLPLINNLRYVDDSTLMAESEEELKSL